MAKPTENNVNHPLSSKTTPQLVNMFRRIMQLDELMSVRESRYQESLKLWEKDIKNPPDGVDVKDPEAYLIKKHREFYGHEMSVTAKFEQDSKRFEEILDSDPEYAKVYKESLSLPEDKRIDFVAERGIPFLANLSESVRAEFKQLKQEMEMGLDVKMRASYFTPEFIKNSPDFDVARDKVRNMIRASSPADMKGVKAEHAGVVNMFNQKYKGLGRQLTAMGEKYPSQVKAAKALLKTGSITLNPSGFLIGRGIGAILQTKAFKKLSDKISVHVDRVAEKTGLKQAIAAKLQSPKGEAYKKLALGSVVAISTFMLTTSLIDHEQAQEIYAGTKDMLENVISAGNDLVMENSEALVDSLDNTGAEALNDLNKGVGDKLPDFGFEDAPKPDSVALNEPSPDDAPKADSVVTKEPSPEDAPKADSPEVDTLVDEMDHAEPVALTGTVYEVQPGDNLSEIAELRLKEAGIPYDYDKIMTVVHMIADENEGITNIHYIQEGDIKLPALDASLVDNYVMQEPSVLPDTLDNASVKFESKMALAEEIQSRFESANMIYSASDIDKMTESVLLDNAIKVDAPANGVKIDMKIIDDIVSLNGVDAPKNTSPDISSIVDNSIDRVESTNKLDKPFDDLPTPSMSPARR